MPSLRLKKIKAADVDRGEWNEFAREHGWFWHTTHWREYTRAQTGASDDAFAITDRRRLVAITATERAADPRAGVWAPAVTDSLGPMERARVLDLCLDELERTGPLRLQMSPLVPNFAVRSQEFLAATIRRGYRDASLTTTVLNLLRDEDLLLADMRKDHRASVLGNDCAVMLHRTVHRSEGARVLLFRDLYERTGGDPERARLLETLWPHTLTAIAWVDDEPVSATLFVAWGDGAYPLAAAGTDGTAGHAVVWGIVRWLKARGCRRYELGIQYRDPEISTEKERNISLFKRGFGGVEMPLIIREKA